MSEHLRRQHWRARTSIGGGRSSRRLLRLALAAILGIASAGCSTLNVHEAWLRNAIDDRREYFETTSHVSPVTARILARHGLLETVGNDPCGAARVLETRFQTEPETDGALALAELSLQAGLVWAWTSPGCAIAWYRDAAALAWLALADPNGSGGGLALRVHNAAVARADSRTACAEAGPEGQSWRQVLEAQGISIHSSAPYLDPQRIADLRVTADLRVKGMDHVYQNGGLGVPLVVHRVVRGQIAVVRRAG